MDHCPNKFNLDFFLREVHNLATEIYENRAVNIDYFCSQFSHSSLEETISIANAFIYRTEDPSLKEAQIQLEHDIKVLKDHLINSESKMQASVNLHRIFRSLFNLQPARAKEHFKDVSRTTLQETLDFLNDFAPNRARALQKELSAKPSGVLFQLMLDEIESHIERIAKAIARRHELLSLYAQPGTFNKLLRIKKTYLF